MIMPFLRLVAIYCVVILGALLIFKRDSVMPLLGISSGGDDAEVAAPAKAPTPPAKPAAAPVKPAPVTTSTPTARPPKYPDAQTAQPLAAPTASAPTAPVDQIQARLEKARQAYWKRDLVTAETLYKSLAADAPDNADIQGELGNLYYGQRRYGEAATYFHLAGQQLIKDGDTRQVMSLIGILQPIAPAKAADLRSRLSR